MIKIKTNPFSTLNYQIATSIQAMISKANMKLKNKKNPDQETTTQIIPANSTTIPTTPDQKNRRQQITRGAKKERKTYRNGDTKKS